MPRLNGRACLSDRRAGQGGRLKGMSGSADGESVMPQVTVVAFAVGAGALALWLDVRFPRLGPTELRGVVLHAICAYGLFLVSGPLFGLAAGDAVWRRLGAIFTVGLPPLVYMLIVGLWVVKLLRGAMSLAR